MEQTMVVKTLKQVNNQVWTENEWEKKQDERKTFIKPREQLIKTTLNDPGKVLMLGSKRYKEMRDKSRLLSKTFPV